MATFEIEGLTELMEGVAEWLNVVRERRRTAFDDVFKKWAADTERAAVTYLNRPNWLLSKSIDGKFKKYADDRKLFAMVGFVADKTPARFTSTAPEFARKRGTWGRVGSLNFKGFTRFLGVSAEEARSPGFYGRYHENGYTRELDKTGTRQAVSANPDLISTPSSHQKKWRVPRKALIWRNLRSKRVCNNRYIHTEALHFLKRAKQENQAEMLDAILTVNSALMDDLKSYLKRAQIATYERRGFDNNRTYRPRVW